MCPRLSVEGTLYYRSPWQILHGVEGDERSDLWALGVALFILFSGHPPFNGDDKASIDRAVRSFCRAQLLFPNSLLVGSQTVHITSAIVEIDASRCRQMMIVT